MNMDMLQANESYQHWQSSEHSCLLALCGQNRTGDSSTTLNWLSPAAVVIIEHLRGSNKTVAYYFCQVEFTMSDRTCPQLQELMACLLYQLRESRPDLVQDGSHRIETAVSSEAWQKKTNRLLWKQCALACSVSQACLTRTKR